MKILSFLLFVCALHISAKSLSQTVTIHSNHKEIAAILQLVKNQTGYNFLYNNKLLEELPPVTISVRNMPLSSFLDLLLADKNLTYTLSGKNILISRERTKRSGHIEAAESFLVEKPQQPITGQVKDSLGTALAGVSISVKNSALETITDEQGRFSIQVSPEDVLIFKYVGYATKQVSVGNRRTLNILLQQTVSDIDEVIVTALGIKREEKALGYAQQTLNAEQLSSAVSSNWSEGLKGKVAGLNIISGGTGPINSQSIQLRGATSLDPGSNYALIVIDGVPMDQETTAYGNNVGAAYGTEAPVDYGNAVSELRQEDIQSVTVLKGPSAAALYGSRAANGALIITTKSGQKNQKLGITFYSSTLLDNIINWPNYQYEYGAGGTSRKDANGNPYYSFGDSEDGPSTNTPEAYGPKFEGQYYYQYDPVTQAQGAERTLWRPYKNNMKDFFRLGSTFENAVSFQGGDDKGSMRLNIAHTDNNYIAPNTGFKKNTISFNGNYQVTQRVKLTTSLNYNNRTSDNLPAFGISNGSLGYFMMFLMPSVDINWYKPIWQNGKENLEQLNPFSAWSSNPYFLMYVDKNPLSSNQIVGNVKTDIKISENWDVMGRLSMNSLTQLRETQRGYSSKKHPRGYYGRQDVASQEINMDFLTSYKNVIGDDFHYNVMAGGSRMSYDHRNVMSSVDALIVPTVFSLANGVNNPLVTTNDVRRQINSLYGMASLSWRDKIFLDLTGRNDWSSTLPANSNSYFYPSATSSFILSDLFQLPQQISYLKYRASYARVGSDADPYQTSKYYSQSGFPSSAEVPSTMHNTNLKPEITSSWETGIDLKLFNSRLGVDATYYSSSTENQILALPADIVAGYSNRVINAGEVRNKGVELVVTGTPIKSPDWEWTVIGNWATNDNKIMALTDNLEQQTLTTVWQGHLIATVGGSTSDLWGTKFVRDPDGNIVFANGVATRGSVPEYIGNTAPEWKAGLSSTLKYKNIRLSFTLDGQYGGLIFSGTYNRASWAGTLPNTIPGRDEGFIVGDGVVKNPDGSYTPNTVQADPQAYYGQVHQTTEAGVFASDFIKLREVSLSYQIPKRHLQRFRIDGLSLSLFGRNLAVFDKFPMFDPEAGTMNGTVFIPGLEITPMPYTAVYGCNLKIDF